MTSDVSRINFLSANVTRDKTFQSLVHSLCVSDKIAWDFGAVLTLRTLMWFDRVVWHVGIHTWSYFAILLYYLVFCSLFTAHCSLRS